jgi:RalA-binding protein 1
MPPHAEARAEAVYQRQLTADTQTPQQFSYSSPSAYQRSNDDLLRPQRLDTQNLSSSDVAPSPAGFFRALPLLPTDLPRTKINVSHSFVRPNDRGKEVLSFIVYVDPGNGKEGWKVEKMYSDVLNLDQRVRTSVGKSVGKKIATLPEGKLWKDHAPAKADQRKAVLETYLQTLINLPVKSNDEVIAFFTTDIVKETMQPVMQAGHKEGYLTKRGKNFGGWKTRYFVLQGPVLEYFDCRGGTHLGSITVAGAQIGRQQRSTSTSSTDEEKEYRHAFLIVEAKKGPGGNHPRHVLCAESDDERDSWVEILVRYFTGTYSDEPVAYVPTSAATAPPPQYSNGASQGVPRANVSAEPVKKPSRGMSKDDGAKTSDAVSIKMISRPSQDGYSSSSPSKAIPISIDTRMSERTQQGQPSSLPDSSPLSHPPPLDSGRPNSEMGHYPDIQTVRAQQQQRQSPELHRHRGETSRQHPSNHASSPVGTMSSERVPSPEKMESKVKISGPMNGAPIPAGYKFGKDAPAAEATLLSPSPSDRREKAKSRSFWGFGRPAGGNSGSGNGDKNTLPSTTFVPRAVFGVNLEESLDVAQIANLPAIVFRSIQYLEAKKADQEEGIYRLSGSSAVIKSLKDRFNAEGDVDLLASDEYWDPHAIAGLLKGFLRELPSSILTRELHMRFLAVIDFVDPQERIKELSQLIASLPIANYSLLRALTAHLILIVQNSAVNKMTMRNVGIVFSPTLGIPAGVFSLMLGEFNRVFNVDADKVPQDSAEDPEDPDRRNSKRYSEGAADKLLGLSGRSLKSTPAEDAHSDTDEFSIHEDSATDAEVAVESSSESPVGGSQQDLDASLANSKTGRASNLAAGLGLNISVSDRGHRYSRMMGLPTSPRPPPSPGGHSSSSPSPAS